MRLARVVVHRRLQDVNRSANITQARDVLHDLCKTGPFLSRVSGFKLPNRINSKFQKAFTKARTPATHRNFITLADHHSTLPIHQPYISKRLKHKRDMLRQRQTSYDYESQMETVERVLDDEPHYRIFGDEKYELVLQNISSDNAGDLDSQIRFLYKVFVLSRTY